MVHKLSDVQSLKIGKNTKIWQYVVVLEGAVIGNDCNINCHTFIENDVVIGDNVTVKSGVYLWDGISIEDNVFIGPNVTFVNDKRPRSKQYPLNFKRIRIGKNSSIGAGSIVIGGVTIGRNSFVAAGALVTRDVPDHAFVKGSPGRVCGWVNEDGTSMREINGFFYDVRNDRWVEKDGKLLKING